MIRRVVLGGLLVAGMGCSGGGAERPATEPEVVRMPRGFPVRVGLMVGVEEVRLGSTRAFTLTDAEGILAIGNADDIFIVRRVDTALAVYTATGEWMDEAGDALTLTPRSTSDAVLVNDAPYPGRLEVRLVPEGGLTVINLTDVETYLRGVVPMEIGHRGGDAEAAKAQAVAARTYVAGHLDQYPEAGFDLHAGVRDQVYGSIDRRHPDADRAVAATAGRVLTYDGAPIRANYASTCGGTTAAVEEGFDTGPLAYLPAQPDEVNGRVCCRSSKYYRWDHTWTGAELVGALARTVPRILDLPWEGSQVRELRVVESGPSGRVVILDIVTDRRTYRVDRWNIRRVLETTEGHALWSTAFRIEPRRDREGRLASVRLVGSGWGHGVGMCQWGAMQLSRDGVDYERILEHYYPGTELTTWTPSTAAAGSRNEGNVHG